MLVSARGREYFNGPYGQAVPNRGIFFKLLGLFVTSLHNIYLQLDSFVSAFSRSLTWFVTKPSMGRFLPL